MTDDTFVLERTENPHPRMLTEAIAARKGTDERYWAGYLAAMCGATGETETAIVAWMDRQEGIMGHYNEPRGDN